MAERLKIMIGNREVAKRYVGSKLVWEAVKKTTERLLLTIKVGKIDIDTSTLTIDTINKNKPAILKLEKIQADNKLPIILDTVIVANVTENQVDLFSQDIDTIQRIENYLSGATIIKFYG